MKKRCWEFTSPAIRWMRTPIKSLSFPPTTPKRWRAWSAASEVAICGILTGIQRKRNKEGKLWAAMHLEDRTGSVEAMVFTTQYDRLLTSLVEDQAVLVRGLVLPEENAPPKISVQDIMPLEVARLDLPTLISIRVARRLERLA